MKYYVITLFILLSSFACIKEKGLNNISNQTTNDAGICQNAPNIPKGKGKLFRITKEEAVNLAQEDYLSKNQNTQIKPKAIACQTTLFWNIMFVEEKIMYVIDRASGNIVQKLALPKIDEKEEEIKNDISCKEAISTAESGFIQKLASLGNSDNEIRKEMSNYYVITCELPNYWLIRFEFNYFSINDLNKQDDFSELPNVHAPAYLIDKKTGKSFLLSN